MILTLASIVVIAAVGFLVLRGGRDRRVGSVRSAHWLRIAGLLPLGLQVAFFLLFGVGEMAGGDLSGAGHLLQVAVAVLLGILAWLKPLEGGAALFILGFVFSMVTAMSAPEDVAMSPAILILAAPLIVSGVLFFIAGMLARCAA